VDYPNPGVDLPGDVAWVIPHLGEGPGTGMGSLQHKLIVGRLEASPSLA